MVQMEKDDRKISGLPGGVDPESLVPYAQKVFSLLRDDFERNQETVAWARLGSEALSTLAVTGEAPFASIVPGGFEYKLAEFEDDLDDPLRKSDLARPTGTTKFFFVVDELLKLGFNINENLSEAEVADLVKFLEDSENDRVPGEGLPQRVNCFVEKAIAAGIPRGTLDKLFNAGKHRTGILIGLSKEFLDYAGEDIWSKSEGSAHNHPCRYAKLGRGLPVEYITQIVALDDQADELIGFLELQVESEEALGEMVGDTVVAIHEQVDELEIDK
ncbi:hypothetical protein C0416_01100 [bacterium]|nr:hypothetical protein [bacterium]